MHWKFMLFNGQNRLQFSAANYSDFYFKPVVPYTCNYTDEGIYFTDDTAVINSFRRKFDDSWVNTSVFAQLRQPDGPTGAGARLVPIDPSMSFVPAEDFAARSVPLYDRETQRIDTIMYKITESRHADGSSARFARGVPVRLVITEPKRYRIPEQRVAGLHVDRV